MDHTPDNQSTTDDSLEKDLSGTILDGKFLVESLIARGGMGSVYRGRHLTLDIPVAIKVINERCAKQEANLKRFAQETAALKAMRHPNIISLYSYSLKSGAGPLYIVMDYLEG